MKTNKNLVFLGMMGSGKTTIGSMISKKLRLDFVDIDKEIEIKVGMNITKIFEVKGEIFFRNLEERITLNKLTKKNIVISLGGGAFLNKSIRDEVLSSHVSFWLNWKNEALISRIKNSKKRPLITRLNSEEILELMSNRSKFYSKSHHKINCDNLKKSEIVNRIVKIYENETIKS
jgi:shikimate kinase